jgi:hypothetical protein
MDAINVIYKENNMMDRLANNLSVGAIFSKFNDDLKKDIVKKNLMPMYTELAK